MRGCTSVVGSLGILLIIARFPYVLLVKYFPADSNWPMIMDLSVWALGFGLLYALGRRFRGNGASPEV